MRTALRMGMLTLALVGSAAFPTAPSLAGEPDVDSPAGPELAAPRINRPDFQQDDGPGQVLDPTVEGADPTPPRVVEPRIVEPLPPPPAPPPPY
jgi:hypothetical protein